MSLDIVRAYYEAGFRVLYWPAVGDVKGPTSLDWPRTSYPIEGYHEGMRVGIMSGTETSPGVFSHDVDIDWAPGAQIALVLLPPTGFVFGRQSKPISHAFFGCPEALPSYRYEDIDKSCLMELRGTKSNGDIGMQTMVPPSVWSKAAHREPLILRKFEGMSVQPAAFLKQRVCLAAIGMLLAKHLGINGFGHPARLAWAGFLLRAGISVDDLVTMGEAMSIYCQNREIHDVRRAVESTDNLLKSQANKKVQGGPALAKLIGPNGKAVIARVNDWLGHDSDFRRIEGVIIKDSQENIRRAVSLLGKELSYNSFSDKMLIDNEPIEDRQMEDLWLRIDEEHHFRPTYMFFEKVIHRMAWDNAFHPVRQYLDALVWDGTPRIDGWLIDAAGAEDTLYIRAISSIVLIAAVKRIREPGCKYDELVILEGAQGLNKSTAIAAMCPKRAWFSDDFPLNMTSQKTIEATLGKWIIEAADLAGKKKAEIETLKSNLSRTVDGPARMAYAHLPVERQRQFVVLGTTNSSAYLTDSTGARRFWPAKVNRFDVGWIVEHRDQMWAEAAHRQAAGESIRLPEELWPHAAEHQEQRREIDPWESVIVTMLRGLEVRSDGHVRVVTTAIWDALGIEVVRRDRYGAMRISEVMQRLGFVRTRVRPGGGADVEVGYAGPALVSEEDRLLQGLLIETDIPF